MRKGCFSASRADIRSFGVRCRSDLINARASSDNFAHTVGFTFRSAYYYSTKQIDATAEREILIMCIATTDDQK